MKDFYKYRQEFTWSCQRALNSGHLTLRHCGCSVLHTARRKSRLNGYWLYILKRRIGSFTFWWINRRDRRETHRQNGCDGNSCIHENWKQERNRQEDVSVTLRTSTSENKHCKEEMIIFFWLLQETQQIIHINTQIWCILFKVHLKYFCEWNCDLDKNSSGGNYARSLSLYLLISDWTQSITGLEPCRLLPLFTGEHGGR